MEQVSMYVYMCIYIYMYGLKVSQFITA